MTSRARVAYVLRALLAICLLATALAAGCGGNDSDAVEGPLPVEERVLQTGDLPGYDVNNSVQVASDPEALFESDKFFVPASDEEVAELQQQLEDAGFVSGAFQFLGGSTEEAGAAGSLVAKVGSAAAAKTFAEQARDATLAPCPDDCSIDFRKFDVQGVPGAKGSSRLRSEAGSSAKYEPFESHHVFFADGPYVYVIYANGRPGGVESRDIADAARKLHERVAATP